MQGNSRWVKIKTVAGAAGMAACAVLTGCGVALSTPNTNYSAPVTLQGQVFAGRNYMANATVKIYATQPTGTASNGTYTGTAKLLTTIQANATGGWVAPNLACTSPDQLYVTTEGGIAYPASLTYTSLPSNPNSLMMTAIGDCSVLSNTLASNNVTTIVTNEATTVAAVEALRPFISLSGTTVNVTSSATNYAGTSGTGVAGNYAGLAHAFLNAANLAPAKTGNFSQYTQQAATPAGGGLVPVQLLNTLAYSLYLCTIGGPSGPGDYSYCQQLYSLTTPPGGTAPTNTLQAMLNIATYPTNQAAAIVTFSLTPIPYSYPAQDGPQQINAGVYVPALNGFAASGSTPLTNDLSVAIYYLTGYGATATGQGTLYPNFVSIDSNDTIYISNPSAATSVSGNVVAITSSGVPLWTSATDAVGLVQPRAIAADQNGHVWVTSGGTTAAQAFVQEMDATTGATIQRFNSTSTSLYGVAVDAAGNVWYDANAVGTSTAPNLHEIAKTGTTYAEATFTSPLFAPYQLLQIRPDVNNNIWVSGYLSTSAASVVLPNTGTVAAPTFTTTVKTAPLTGVAPYGVATDASGRAYMVTNTSGTNTGAVSRITLTGTGATATPVAANVSTTPVASNRFMDIDGGGNIWYLDNGTGLPVYQYNPTSSVTTPFYPCYNPGTNASGSGSPNTGVTSTDGKTSHVTAGTMYCTTGISNRIDLAVDSTGAVWVASSSNANGGRMVQILGLGTPTVPLKALGKPGVMP